MTQLSQVSGINADELAVVNKLLGVWQAKRVKNSLLSVYHDGKQVLKDYGISIPPQMRGVEAALEWPAKAVRALARKHQFEGFSLDGDLDPFGLNEVLESNSFDLELTQGISAAYKYCFSLLTAHPGDTSVGEPEVVIHARGADWSAALWDNRRREVSDALTITVVDDVGEPVELVYYGRHDTVLFARSAGRRWVAERLGNPTGRTLVEILPHDPQLNRPFGRSRISREIRYLTDAAIRTLVRGEVSAEFFSAPQRYALGVEDGAFSDMNRWSAVIGRVWALSTPEDQQHRPDVGQFSQISMSPHWEMYRQLAQNFCAAASLPQSSVGLYAANPESAEAMQAAEAQLAEDAEYQWRVFRPALLRLQQNVLMIRDGLSEPPAETWKTNVNWTPARYISPQAASDWAIKAVTADESLTGSTVILRRLGLSQGDIEEVRAEERRNRFGSAVDALVSEFDAAPVETGL